MKQPTQEEFDTALESIIDAENPRASMLLSIPGVYECLSEHYNNAALELIEWAEESEQ